MVTFWKVYRNQTSLCRDEFTYFTHIVRNSKWFKHDGSRLTITEEAASRTQQKSGECKQAVSIASGNPSCFMADHNSDNARAAKRARPSQYVTTPALFSQKELNDFCKPSRFSAKQLTEFYYQDLVPAGKRIVQLYFASFLSSKRCLIRLCQHTGGLVDNIRAVR